jgi:CRP/FNR family transcriptional regulator, cyclic AMP receptor protein
MSEETVAAGSGWRCWPDGTLMSRLDEHTGEELVSLVPGVRYREGSVLISQGARDMQVNLLEPASPGRSACVKVTACLENGQETLLGIGVSGDVVGEQAVRPDELVVDRATATAGDAAGDLPGPPW